MSSRARPAFPLAAVAIPLVILCVWAIPRLIRDAIGFDNPWAAFLYQYGLGGLVFGVGLLIIRRSGACDFDRPGDRFWFGVLIFGYVWYALMHAILIGLAVSVPALGTP